MPSISNYSQDAVRFASGNNQIAGRLTIPAGEGPFPAVVFIHGSGRADWSGGGLFLPLFEEFASRGIASFCWDKPGVGESTGDYNDQSFDDRAEEGIAAIESLRQIENIDSDRIGLWGISQAGWVMPLICAEAPSIAFVIGVSVPVCTVIEQDMFRIKHTLSADGFSAEDTEKALDLVRRIHQLALADATYEEAVDQLQDLFEEPWAQAAYGKTSSGGFAFLKRIMSVDPKPKIKSMSCPVLVILGEKDTLVNIEETASAYRRLLAESGNDDLTIEKFPGADHIMTVAETGGQKEIVGKIHGADWQYIPGYIEQMGKWLQARVNA